MSKEQTELAEAVAKIYAAIEAAKEIADKQNTTFDLYPANPKANPMPILIIKIRMFSPREGHTVKS